MSDKKHQLLRTWLTWGRDILVTVSALLIIVLIIKHYDSIHQTMNTLSSTTANINQRQAKWWTAIDGIANQTTAIIDSNAVPEGVNMTALLLKKVATELNITLLSKDATDIVSAIKKLVHTVIDQRQMSIIIPLSPQQGEEPAVP